MRVSPEIRHTCGILHWLKQQAEHEVGGVAGAGSVTHGRFIELVRWRFGRDLSGIVAKDAAIEEIGRAIQTLPQIDSVRPRFLFRREAEGAGRILLLPGLHGTVATFHRLVDLISPSATVAGWDHLGLDESRRRPKRLDDIAASILEAEYQDGLRKDEPLIIFGFCIGGILGHSILEQHEGRLGSLVILDGHPAESIRGISRMRRVVGITKALRDAARGGQVERRLVRIGLDRLRSLGLHQTGSIENPITLYRTGAPLAFGPLSADTWRAHAREVRRVDLPDLGHNDVFRNRHEGRIADAIRVA